jgi:hypothetical protein
VEKQNRYRFVASAMSTSLLSKGLGMSARRQCLRAVTATALSLAVLGTSATASPSPLEPAAERAVAARQKMMQQDATAADVDAFLALCIDGLIYEDPVVKMRIEGKEEIRKGMIAFLAASRNARVVVTRRIATANVVVLEQTVSFEEKQDDGGWKPRARDQVTIFEFEGSKIRRLADYWSRWTQFSRLPSRQMKPHPPPSSLTASISSLLPFFKGR